jgi:hypothetical protein
MKEQDFNEVVKSFVLTVKLNKKEQKEAAGQLNEARQKLRDQASPHDL